METLTRKQIEDYYAENWKDVFSSKALAFFIETTCKEYINHRLQSVNYFENKKDLVNLGQY